MKKLNIASILFLSASIVGSLTAIFSFPGTVKYFAYVNYAVIYCVFGVVFQYFFGIIQEIKIARFF